MTGVQTCALPISQPAGPVHPKTPPSKESAGGGREGAAAAILRRQSSTNPPGLHHPHRPPPQEGEPRAEAGGATEEKRRKPSRSKMEEGFGSALAACLERPQAAAWGEAAEAERAGGAARAGVGAGVSLEGRRGPSPLAGVKASIINELSSKLQQMGNKSLEVYLRVCVCVYLGVDTVYLSVCVLGRRHSVPQCVCVCVPLFL